MPFDGTRVERRKPLIKRALTIARKAAPHLDQLAVEVLPWLDQPMASANIRCHGDTRSSRPVWLDRAVTLPWMALDSWHERTVLAIDVDHSEAAERAEILANHYGLPRPTIVADPYTGRAHVFWLLLTPVLTSDRFKEAPRRLFNLAGRMLALAMAGTLLPARALLKSPWGLSRRLEGPLMHRSGKPATPAVWDAYQASKSPLVWHTLIGDLLPVELRKIVATLDEDYGAAAKLSYYRKRGPRYQPGADVEPGRNCALFNEVRFGCYRRCERDPQRIHDMARSVNAARGYGLDAKEVAGVAGSIAGFMAHRFRPGYHRVAAGTALDQAAEHERLASAARKSRASVMDKNTAAISAAVAKLQAESKPVTQAAVAAAAGVSVRTVRRHQQRHRPRSPAPALSSKEDTSHQVEVHP